MLHKIARILLPTIIGLKVFISANIASATIVRFETSLGDIDVNLFDESTPLTVANFLSYVDSDAYDGTMVHRSVPGFIIQGGGFAYSGLDQDDAPIISSVSTLPPVSNEPLFSNVRATIAMAKLQNDPDSATSQWFFNLSDNNASNLDFQNGGFTVFGQVISGMDVIDQIAGLDVWNLSGAFVSSALAETPLQNFSTQAATDGDLPNEANFIEVADVSIIDTTVDSAANLNPELRLIADDADDGSGGGPLSPSILFFLLFGYFCARKATPKYTD